MGRPFCIMELRWAKLYGCTIIGVVEKDARHGAVDFGREVQLAPSDLKDICADVEFIECVRRPCTYRDCSEHRSLRGSSSG